MEKDRKLWAFFPSNASGGESDNDAIEMTSAKVVVFSLESKESVLSKRVVKSLENDKKAVVRYYPLFNIQSKELDKIREDLQKEVFSVYFVSAHGESWDNNHIYYEDFDAANGSKYPRGKSADEVSDLLLSILPEKEYATLELLVCSSARTSQWEINHIEPEKEINWLDSLAYRIFYRLVKVNRLASMTAFVTPVAYEAGKYLAQHEDVRAIQCKMEKLEGKANEIQRQANELYDQNKKEEAEMLMERWIELVENQMVPLETKKYSLSRIENYGRVVFNYNKTLGICSITLHHMQETPRELYLGPLKEAPTIEVSDKLEKDVSDDNDNNNFMGFTG